jgi:hypothetical protein
MVLPLALVVVWLRSESMSKPRQAIVTGVGTAALAFCLGLVLERSLDRARPFVELGFTPLVAHVADASFPSDHTLTGAALVGPLLWCEPRVGVLLVVWALVVGVARVAAGLHHPSGHYRQRRARSGARCARVVSAASADPDNAKPALHLPVVMVRKDHCQVLCDGL